MHAHAIHHTREGHCRHGGETYDLAFLWRAITGRGGEPEEEHGHRAGHRHHRGPGPRGDFGGFGGFPFGGSGPGGFGRGGGPWRGGRKARRGDIRTAALLLLAEEPRNGYQIMQEVEERSDGAWRPSPGSVYPALQQLEDEGLVAFERVDGRKTATLTDTGKQYVEEHRAELGAPWDDVSGGVSGEARELRQLIGALMGAVHTVSHVGTKEQVSQASEVLVQARKSLYRILAEDEPTS
jgi:DNA-binding PadR family transcriptional regulator